MSRQQKKKAVLENKKALNNSQTFLTAKNSFDVKKPLRTKPEKISAVQAVKSDRFHKIREFFMEVKLELSKVIWPTKKQITGTTLVVIVFVLIVSIFLGFFDLGLSTLVQLLLA